MSILFKAICKNCDFEDSLLWGDGMNYIQFQCTHCLKTFGIPRHAPRPNRDGREVPKFLETRLFKSYPPTPFDEIIRLDDAELEVFLSSKVSWQNGDDDWDQYEIDKILKLIACECDASKERVGRDQSPKTRCKSCNSTNIEFGLEKLAD